jgi:hypothetical protein
MNVFALTAAMISSDRDALWRTLRLLPAFGFDTVQERSHTTGPVSEKVNDDPMFRGIVVDRSILLVNTG